MKLLPHHSMWVASLALSIFLSSVPLYAQAQTGTPGVLIDQLVQQIQIGLAKVQKDLTAQGLPPLDSVTLDLQTEAKRQVGAKINLYVISFGKKWERDRSQEVEITLQPPSPSLPLHAAAAPSIADELVGAIESAAMGTEKAKANQEVPLRVTGLKAILNFVVQADTSGGLNFKISPITVDFSGDLANSAIQKITVLYQTPDKSKK